MGVKSESISALNDKAAQVRRDLIAQYGFSQRASDVCAKAQNSTFVDSFIKP
jgi:hypothetical protein